MLHPSPKWRRHSRIRTDIRPARATQPDPKRRPGWLLFVLLLLLPSLLFAANTLRDSPSPYLALHGQDPVHWQPWSQAVLERARRENRLIFISSGYFSCYWCHRMQQDVYRHEDAAALLNRHTIPVKVDRELDPALDHYLITFAQRTTGRAGWPVHVLLTPDGLPFYAFLYQPKPAFMQIITRAARLWQTQPEKIRHAARQALPQPTPYPPAGTARLTLTPAQLAQRLFEQLRHQLDDFSGGLKGQQKFPETPLLLALVSYPALPDDIRDWLILTLDHMADGHLRDHVHGGFFRYTVDPDWHTPHYEKMLYDNAQLATLYLQAGQRFDHPRWRQIGLETLHFLDQALYNPDTGLFYGSLSAMDAHHEEGGAYLWTAERLKAVLSPEQFTLIAEAWHLDEPGPWDGKWLPAPIDHPAWPAIRARLRQASPSVPRDDKQLIGWNALMVTAWLAAADATGERQWRKRAEALMTRLLAHFDRANPPRALAADGRPMGTAMLEDGALLIAAAEALAQSDVASRLRQRVAERHLDRTGWKLAPAPLLPGQSGEKWLPDGPLPSLTAILDRHATVRLAAAAPLLQAMPVLSASYLRYQTLPASPPASTRLKH